MSSQKKSKIYFNDYIDYINSKPGIVIKEADHYLKQYLYLSNIIDIMPSALYLLDYQTQRYLYVSKEMYAMSGYTSEEVMQNGHAWLLTILHPEDLEAFSGKVFQNFVEYTRSLPFSKLKNSRFSLNYRIRHKNGNYIQFLDQHVILETDSIGNPILVLGVCSDITAHKSDNKVIFSISELDCEIGYKTISTNSFPEIEIEMTVREKEILFLLKDGCSSKEIAKKLSISYYTVNAHRRNLLEKTNCKNTTDLLNKSVLYNLF